MNELLNKNDQPVTTEENGQTTIINLSDDDDDPPRFVLDYKNLRDDNEVGHKVNTIYQLQLVYSCVPISKWQ